jgi:hypothetical protein
MTTEAQNVKFRRQLAKLDASRKPGATIKMPPREVIRIKRRCKLRSVARGVSQIRHLPHLFSQHGQRRPYSWREKGELVRAFSREPRERDLQDAWDSEVPGIL